MPTGSLSRSDLVDALDDLGEREHLSPSWQTDDVPYPAEAVRERSKRLRWRLRWRRWTFILFMLLVAAIGGLDLLEWTIPDPLLGFLGGFGLSFVGAWLLTDPWTDDQVRALQLYDLLKQLDDRSDSAA